MGRRRHHPSDGSFDLTGGATESTVRYGLTTGLPTRADAKRAQIRAAAQDLFLRHGFHATSTDAITAAAAVSKETLYRYYPKKEDLFVDVLRALTIERSFWVEATDRAAEPRTAQELRRQIHATVEGLLATLSQPEYLAMLRLIVAESPRLPELGDLFQQTIPQQGFSYFAALLAAGRRNGLVKEQIDPATVARMVLGSILTFVLPNGLIRTTAPPKKPDPRAIKSLVAHTMELISRVDGSRSQ